MEHDLHSLDNNINLLALNRRWQGQGVISAITKIFMPFLVYIQYKFNCWSVKSPKQLKTFIFWSLAKLSSWLSSQLQITCVVLKFETLFTKWIPPTRNNLLLLKLWQGASMAHFCWLVGWSVEKSVETDNHTMHQATSWWQLNYQSLLCTCTCSKSI